MKARTDSLRVRSMRTACKKWYAANRERKIAAVRAYQEVHKDKCKAWKKAYEKRKRRDHLYYLKNREKIIARAVAWRKANLEAAREACRKYSRKKKAKKDLLRKQQEETSGSA